MPARPVLERRKTREPRGWPGRARERVAAVRRAEDVLVVRAVRGPAASGKLRLWSIHRDDLHLKPGIALEHAVRKDIGKHRKGMTR